MTRVKPGDKIIFRYPMRSTWDDTKYAVDEGFLISGKTYVVSRGPVVYGPYMGDSVFVHITDKHGRPVEWGLSLACFEVPPLRKLPDWW